ncbi:MAG: GNAT family N-acetyltransferase [Terracoccus sp.]
MNGDPVPHPTDETPGESPGDSPGESPDESPDESPGAPASEPTPGHRLSADLTVGGRVVVRYRLAEGSAAGATDFVGSLIARNDDFLIVDTRTERVKLIRTEVIAARDVPPAAARSGPAHLRVSVDDLERVMATGWPATDLGGLGEWQLRSAGGFTGRANSVLAVGDPSLPLDRAIDFCEKWYDNRDAPTLFQITGEAGFAMGDQPVGSALLGRGYVAGGGRSDWERILVMTASAKNVPPLTTDSVPVNADAVLRPDWLMAYGEQRPVVPGVTEAVLTGSAGQLFLSVRDEASGRIVGVSRMSISPGWAGIFAVWVHPDHQRRGIATAMTSSIALVAKENNMAAIFLQVSGNNPGAIAFYERLGFVVHHEYSYLGRTDG